MTTRSSLPNQISLQSEDDDDGQQFSSSSSNSKLSVEQGKTRYITILEAIGLDFHSFIPQADITSQDGDRILQVNGINVTNLEHEDVRKLMQLMTPIVFTVASDLKYLLLLQQPIIDTEEKSPEPFIAPDEENGYEDNKIIIRAMTLSTNHVELTVLAKKIFQCIRH